MFEFDFVQNNQQTLKNQERVSGHVVFVHT